MADTTITLFYSRDASQTKVVILSTQNKRSSYGNCVLLVTTDPEEPFLVLVYEDFPQ